MRLTEDQLQPVAEIGSQLYGEVGKLLGRWLDTIQRRARAGRLLDDDPQAFAAFIQLARAMLELMAERLNGIAEMAEVAGPDDEALVILLRGMLAPSADG